MEEKEKDALQQEENATPKPADKKEALAKEETVDAPKAENALEAEETGVASEVEKQAKAANIADNQQEEDEQEVESDEHEDVDEYASDSKEMPDYAHMPVNKLVAEASKLLKDRPIQEIKEDMEVIHSSALKTLDDIRNEKLHQLWRMAEMKSIFTTTSLSARRYRTFITAIKKNGLPITNTWKSN
jgi:hypothetical protein